MEKFETMLRFLLIAKETRDISIRSTRFYILQSLSQETTYEQRIRFSASLLRIKFLSQCFSELWMLDFELKPGFRLQDAFQKFDYKGTSYIYIRRKLLIYLVSSLQSLINFYCYFDGSKMLKKVRTKTTLYWEITMFWKYFM